MKKNLGKTAFSLIELSVVLLIISILIVGSLSVSVTSVNNAKAKSTNEKIKTVYQALGAFVLKNYRIPCPASLVIAKNASTYGAEIGTAGTCASGAYLNTVGSGQTANQVAYGMVPVSTLGLAPEFAEDAYGNKLGYVVSVKFTKSDGYPSVTTTDGFSFSSSASGVSMIQIIDQPSGVVVDSVMFAIVSLGQNKFGAFNANSTAQNGTSTDTSEAQNYPTVATSTTAAFGNVSGYTTRVTLTSSSLSSDVFDDIVFYKTRENLLSDFNAQFLVGCASSTYTGVKTYNTGNAYYGTVVNASTTCSAPTSLTPTYRCVSAGPNASSAANRWQAIDTCSTY